jgi:broad specificity phosphatase PhoE
MTDRLILIRHPATTMSGTFCGHSDPDLSPTGEGQLQVLCRRLRRTAIDRIVSSDLRRARRCADALAGQHSLQAEFRPALREIHFGHWEGLLWSDIEARYGEEAQRWIQGFPGYTAPGAEPYADFTRRIRDDAIHWLQDLGCETLVVVTHRGVLHYLLQSYCALESAAAWRISGEPATVIFCRVRANGAMAVQRTWSAGSGTGTVS